MSSSDHEMNLTPNTLMEMSANEVVQQMRMKILCNGEAANNMTYLFKNPFARPKSTSKRYLLLFATVFGGSLLVVTVNNHTDFLNLNSTSGLLWTTNRYGIFGSEESYTIKTDGCTIPGLHPFNESIMQFINRPIVNHCSDSSTDSDSLLLHNDTHIWINKNTDVLEYFKIPGNANITCCYRAFFRPSAIADIEAGDVDDRVKYDSCIHFLSQIEVRNEFVKVSCGYDHRILYEQFFLFAPKKPLHSNRKHATKMLQNQSAYNVILMGIDAISRLNFYRTMPKTLAFLKYKEAIELLGYNKVGDNTFPNLTPMLLGIRDTDLKRTCWPNNRATFDNCPFIWKWYKDAGFYTALGEDSARLGTFNFQKFGFSGTPTDYYIRTFMHEAEVNVGKNLNINSFLCMGNKYFYKVLLDFVESLSKTLKSSKLFGFFWEVTMSHDYLNYPMLIDDSYELFLRRLDSTRYLDNTIFILLSDHGMRWGDIRFTKQGQLEERLPFVHILLPPSFRKRYSLAFNNLKINSNRLTTPFDIHATLSDLINLDTIKNEAIQSRSRTNYAQGRSISLFLPIPGTRTCYAAGIDDHWCTCHRSSKLLSDNVESNEASIYLVTHLNNLLHDYSQCAKLKLEQVLEVSELFPGTPRGNEVGWREFMVTVKTTPGDGVFEGTLRKDIGGWSMAGTASRLNLYGQQSHCVHEYQIKLYCFCQ